MADPFEVRMKFSGQLSTLNASINSAQKAATYAIKYKDMSEDLHSCILESLERLGMNNRANIMYFIEQLCEMAQRERQLDFVRMIERDIMQIVDSVTPPDGSGAANIKVVRKVLGGLQTQKVLSADTVGELEELIRDRDAGGAHLALSSDVAMDDVPRSPRGSKIHEAKRLDKRQIAHRIEEDRERHKRLREEIWAVDPAGDKEFEKLWDDASDIGEDDFIAAEEDAQERRLAAHELD